MNASSSTVLLFGIATLACSGGSDDNDVTTADATVIVEQTSCGGEIPEFDGEFLALITNRMQLDSKLQFIANTTVDSTVVPATVSLTFQPLCTQREECSLGDPVGAAVTAPLGSLTPECTTTIGPFDLAFPGSANTINGLDAVGNLTLELTMSEADFYCGRAFGEIIAGGNLIPDTIHFFGANRITDGFSGTVFACP